MRHDFSPAVGKPTRDSYEPMSRESFSVTRGRGSMWGPKEDICIRCCRFTVPIASGISKSGAQVRLDADRPGARTAGGGPAGEATVVVSDVSSCAV